jgi:hypothetical protein
MLVESALVIGLVMVPLLLGVVVIGFNLIRALQVNQINRDAGHMFARGVDFSGSSSGLVNQGILFKMAPRLETTTTSGTGILILSTVQYIGPNQCNKCNNLNHAVFIQRIILGNAALKLSDFGTVPAASLNTDGTVKSPTTDSAARADGILTYLALQDGDRAYISETYFSSSDLSIPGFPSPSGTSARAIF